MNQDARAEARPRRRTQAERTEATRARLSAAAFDVVARSGLTALRLRAVAEEAGVSQGALLHHFPDKNAIVIAAIEEALGRAAADSASHLEARAQDRESILRAMLEEMRGFFFSDRFWVAMGITMEASRDPELHPEIAARVARLRKPIYEDWAARLVVAGWSPEDAERIVRSAAAIVSGAAVRRFWAEPDEISAAVQEEWIADRLR